MSKKSASQKKILIAEDNLLLSEVHKRLLEKMGFVVLGQKESAEGAIEAVNELEPDLIIMDINLSGKMNGIQAAGKIHIPVIYLSASSSDKLQKKAMAKGAADYLVKPVESKELEDAIQKALSAEKD